MAYRPIDNFLMVVLLKHCTKIRIAQEEHTATSSIEWQGSTCYNMNKPENTIIVRAFQETKVDVASSLLL